MSEEPKDFKVVEGDGSNLEISPVYDHINNIQQPRKKQREEIVIPEVKKHKKEVIKKSQMDDFDDVEIDELGNSEYINKIREEAEEQAGEKQQDENSQEEQYYNKEMEQTEEIYEQEAEESKEDNKEEIQISFLDEDNDEDTDIKE